MRGTPGASDLYLIRRREGCGRIFNEPMTSNRRMTAFVARTGKDEMSEMASPTASRRAVAPEGGQSLAEMALVLPILLILIFGVIEFSMALRSYIVVTNATREGARYGALGAPSGSYPTDCTSAPGNATIVGRTCGSLNGLKSANVTSVSATTPNGPGSGKSLVVTTKYTYHFFTPVGGLIRFFSGGAYSDQIDFTSSTTMRLE